jgi:hypothetical protein
MLTWRRTTCFLGTCVVIVSVLALTVGPAAAGRITAPQNNFVVPLDASQPNGLGFVTITATGYPVNTNVSIMICNGNNPGTDRQWDPNADCDSGSAPPAVNSGASGTVTFRASDPARHITFFDGANPSGTFDCLHPGEPDPADGLTHWGGGNRGDGAPCQVIVSTSTVSATSDQTLVTFILPNSPRAGCGSTCQSSAAQPAGAPSAPQGAAPQGATSQGAALQPDGPQASSATGSPNSTTSPGHLANTGLSIWGGLMTGLALIAGGLSCLVVGRRPRRHLP